MPVMAPESSVGARNRHPWQPDALAQYEWLEGFQSVPMDAAPPLSMTLPADDAVGSYGWDAIEWIEQSLAIKLRWWQRLAVVRQLEYRKDGTLCYRTVLESCPRRAGKSVRIRGMALWRMANPDLFGEPQTIVHTGSDVAICREVQRGAWRWAEDVADWTVSRSNGKEALETPSGDRWLVRAQRAVYGYDVCLGIIDEAWDVNPETVSDGLEPATLERRSPQIHLTSTAHRRATSLMRSALAQAMNSAADPETLLMFWGAVPGSDPSDPEVWRAASPYWSEDRRRMIASKYRKALAGESDPEMDDPDPIKGFESQYLNVWHLQEQTGIGESAFDIKRWAECADPRPMDHLRDRIALCVDVAIDGSHATLVAAAMDGAKVRAEVVQRWNGPGSTADLRRDLPALVAKVRPRLFGWFPAGPAAALAADMADRPGREWPPRGVKLEEIRTQVAAVCMGLADAVNTGLLRHSGDDMLRTHAEAAMKAKRGDGWVFARRGHGPIDGMYALAGAVHLARVMPAPRGNVVVL